MIPQLQYVSPIWRLLGDSFRFAKTISLDHSLSCKACCVWQFGLLIWQVHDHLPFRNPILQPRLPLVAIGLEEGIIGSIRDGSNFLHLLENPSCWVVDKASRCLPFDDTSATTFKLASTTRKTNHVSRLRSPYSLLNLPKIDGFMTVPLTPCTTKGFFGSPAISAVTENCSSCWSQSMKAWPPSKRLAENSWEDSNGPSPPPAGCRTPEIALAQRGSFGVQRLMMTTNIIMMRTIITITVCFCYSMYYCLFFESLESGTWSVQIWWWRLIWGDMRFKWSKAEHDHISNTCWVWNLETQTPPCHAPFSPLSPAFGWELGLSCRHWVLATIAPTTSHAAACKLWSQP